MSKYDLSVLIPARNEMFLSETVNSLLETRRGNTEILVGLDGEWADPGIPDHPDVTIVYYPESIGQRAITNQLCKLSKAKYVMKLDAHCKLDEGFDIKLMEAIKGHDDWTVIPALYNLHMFDWVCIGKWGRSGDPYLNPIPDTIKKDGCGERLYQGPTPEKCPKCGGNMERELVFQKRDSRRSEFYRFDKNLHFQYWGEFKNRPEAQGTIAPSLSAQGSCFMLTRDKYWELDICDEGHGSWGQQGTEVACKTWLSGGALMIVKNTWYSHMFRTQGGDFGFPYPLSGSAQDKAREYSKKLWLENGWPKAIHDLNWLIEKFKPVPGWHDDTQDINIGDSEVQATEISVPSEKMVKKPKKGVVYYTDNELDPAIMQRCQKQLLKGMKEKHIVSVSLKPLQFGKNFTLNRERGYLAMAEQILKGLRESDAEVIFFCEHDVMYHPSHFDFIPPEKDKIYYNTNVWRVRKDDGHALYTDDLKQLSGLCAYRDTLIKHYEQRVKMLDQAYIHLKMADREEEYTRYVRAMGFEPGTHGRPERVDDLKSESYQSEFPNIDIRHDSNLTPSRWKKEQFRNQRYTKGWTESKIDKLPGWDIELH